MTSVFRNFNFIQPPTSSAGLDTKSDMQAAIRRGAASFAQASCRRRGLATEATLPSTSYPFSKVVTIAEPPSNQPEGLLRGVNLMRHLDLTLPSQSAKDLLAVHFSPTHKDRIPPGSVLNVLLSTAPSSFAGVLISVRHKGADTTFTLRNVVQRTGIEMRFTVGSPLIKDVQIIQRASGKKSSGDVREGKRMRRAKLFYLRDQPTKMTAISSSVKRSLA